MSGGLKLFENIQPVLRRGGGVDGVGGDDGGDDGDSGGGSGGGDSDDGGGLVMGQCFNNKNNML